MRYEELIAASCSNNRLLTLIANHFGVTVSDKIFQELETRTNSSGAAVKLSWEEAAASGDIIAAAASRLGCAIQ